MSLQFIIKPADLRAIEYSAMRDTVRISNLSYQRMFAINRLLVSLSTLTGNYNLVFWMICGLLSRGIDVPLLTDEVLCDMAQTIHVNRNMFTHHPNFKLIASVFASDGDLLFDQMDLSLLDREWYDMVGRIYYRTDLLAHDYVPNTLSMDDFPNSEVMRYIDARYHHIRQMSSRQYKLEV